MLTPTSTTAQSERLRSIPLFAGLSQPGLRHVAAAAAEVEVPPGRLIIERGQPGSGTSSSSRAPSASSCRAGSSHSGPHRLSES